ncbi:hypothetical protein GCK72_013405 [Caenorhabditis remanei]|uniref:non-specific serine/threonine protein kinase n=1 Tax=Caenorhabditis remanei TaxID=31234 RepID=A0A6A5GNQ0_CAERE|nr:hypothetical protein GCK72_013405 [Caenorhabditis remanei]KAF1756950.1 hypothetical protein GCK72_013405 [Caenorhabditis remanei]
MADSMSDAVEQIIVSIDDKISGYQVVEKIDEGAYGQVFKVTKDSKKYAMKIEPKRLDGAHSTLKKEMEIMLELNRQNAKYFPTFSKGGMECKFHILVMTLLGDNLKKLRQKSSNPNSCSNGTWSRIGIQCLYVVKQMHDCGILHHDIKPSNFVIGDSDSEILTNRVFHLIDFGISRKFVRTKKGGPVNASQPNDLEFRPFKKSIDSLKGTPVYTSPNAHNMVDLGRLDDIWSLMYMIAELVKPLPWSHLEGKQLEKVKLKTKLKTLFDNDSFDPIEEMLRSGNFYSYPNYETVYNAFKSVYDSSGCSWLDPYDWETRQMASYARWKEQADQRRHLFAWEYSEVSTYFKKDQWSILQVELEKKSKDKKDKKKKSVDSKKNKDEAGTLSTTTCEEIASTPVKKQKGGPLKKAVTPKPK